LTNQDEAMWLAISYDPSPAIVQVSLILVNLCLSLGEVYGFPAFWDETFLCF
jgi:hypothetical protein